MRGRDSVRPLLGILKQKVRGQALREILEQEILHVEKNRVEKPEHGAKDRVFNADVGVQHGFKVGERHDDGADVDLGFKFVVVEDLRRGVPADVNDVLAAAHGDRHLVGRRGNQGNARTPRKKGDHSDARAAEIGNLFTRVPLFDGGMRAKRVGNSGRDMLPERKHTE